MIAEHIKNGISKLYSAGYTQQEIAQRAGIPGNSIISQLLSRKKDANNLRLSVAEKLINIIPEIQVLVNGKVENGSAPLDLQDTDYPAEKADSTLQVADSSVTYELKIEKLEKRIMASSEFDSETKVKLYQMIKDL